jgi:glutathione S-transferase
MKLYFSPGSCSLSPHIALREAALPFELEKVDLRSKEMASGGDYRQVNPKGSVPALKLPDGTVLTEGAALLQYIADQAPEKNLAPKAGTMQRYRLQEWLNFVATEIHKGFSPLFRADQMVTQAEGNAQFKAALIANLHNKFKILAEHLEKHEYLMDHFTVADGYLFTVLRWAKAFKIELPPAIQSFQERVQARPAVAAALKAESPK